MSVTTVGEGRLVSSRRGSEAKSTKISCVY
jgi:hypothetical protein